MSINKILIISAPRTSSTLLLKILSQALSSLAINEPEHCLKMYKEGKLLKKEAQKILTENSIVFRNPNSVVVIKSMSSWIVYDYTFFYNKIIKYADKIFVPLYYPRYSIESKIRKHIESYLIRNSVKLTQYEKEYWQSKLKKHDYTCVIKNGILKNIDSFGWKQLEEIVEKINTDNIEFICMYKLRTFPSQTIQQITKNCLNINISTIDINLSSNCNIINGQKEKHQVNWYDKVMNHHTILAPTRNSVDPKFPEEIQNYLDTIAYPIYKKYHKLIANNQTYLAK